MRPRQRAVWHALGITALAAGILGMGSLGGGRESGAPVRDFRTTFVDIDGASVSTDHVTCGGGTTLEGDLGRGRLRVPFENIARIDFQRDGTDRDMLRATVTLRDGAPVTLAVRSSTTFYGQLPSGAYQIRARDLRSVEFAP
jgi:hypothetical protein